MDTIDDIGRRAAATLHDDVAGATDVDALLDDLLVAADRGPTSTVRPLSAAGRPRRWGVWGAAAAVAAALIAVLVVLGTRGPTRTIVPATSTPADPVPTAPVDPAQTTTTVPVPSTTAPAGPTTSLPTGVTVRPTASGDGLAVSYRDPPPYLEPQVVGSVATSDDGSMEFVTVMESGIVVLDGSTATIVDWTGAIRSVEVRPDFDHSGFILLAAGPDEVLYAAATAVDPADMSAATIVAVPLSGDRAGEVVATTPADLNGMIERQYGWVGHGPTGLVDRLGFLGELAPYVTSDGGSLAGPLDIASYRRDADTVVRVDAALSWALQIERAAGSGDAYNGPAAPAPAPDGDAVWWDWIGPRSSDGDYDRGTMQVVTFLHPDGSATWRRVPDGWQVVAADLWGTVLARRDGTTLELALATTATTPTAPTTAAQQAVTDYLTALASRDYVAAEAILGNSGLSPSERSDLLPIHDLLGPDEDLAGALQQWCERGAACWMPAGISAGTPTAPDAPRPLGTDVVATYETVGPNPARSAARFVATTWEGQPTVYGLPPLVGFQGTQTARTVLGVDELFVDDPDDVGAVWIASSTGDETVGAPLRGIGMHASAASGSTITWTTPDPVHSVVTDTGGTVVCEADGMIVELRGEPGAYRAVLEQEIEAGPMDDPAPRPAVEIDCATGAETPTDPVSWNGGPINRRLVTAGGRTFTLTSTDHHGELVNDAGVTLGAEDPLIGAPAFSPDGTVVAYPTTGGAANPNVAPRIVAVDTTTGERLWEYVTATDVAAVWVTAERVVVSTRADASGASDESGRPIGAAALTALDLATGEPLATVPASLAVIHLA